MLRIDFVTLFPEMIRPLVESSILGRAASRQQVQFGWVNPRDFTYDRHQKVDDSPYGGEPGMLIKPEPIARALRWMNLAADTAIVLPEPAAPVFAQAEARALSTRSRIVFVCGHYEGIDQRISERFATHIYSLGDFVLTSGEIAAAAMADAIVRLVPGVLGSADSLAADSFSDGLLAAPNYTRPEVWEGLEVPEVLRQGDHAAIEAWRRDRGIELTQAYRPDLLARARLQKRDLKS